MTIHIPDAHDGKILRSYLKYTLGLSTAVLTRLKADEQGILVNGRRVTVRYLLHAGDILELRDRDTEDTATERVIPVDLPLSVLYEDDYIIALHKPANMPTHPSHGHLCDTLANALAHRYRQAAEPFVFRPLGRLDRNTSGIVLAGKTRAASGALGRALRRGEVTKRYIALLTGEMPCDGLTHTLRFPIRHDPAVGIRRTVAAPDATDAVSAETRYRVLAAGGGLSLVLCEPVTGRTHQLRLHFSHIGHPILGDEIYGESSPHIQRHALHALSISLPLPFFALGEPVTRPPAASPYNTPTPDGYLHTYAPVPPDMEEIIRRHIPHAPSLTDPTLVGVPTASTTPAQSPERM